MLDPNKIQLFQNNLEQISLGLNGDIEIIARSMDFAHSIELGTDLKEILDTLEKGLFLIDALSQKAEKISD